MELPKWHETFIPCLDVLKDGELLHYAELARRVRNKHYSHLPEELLQKKTKSGQPIILNRIGWAKSGLKNGGYISSPERGFVRINEKGLRTLEKGSLTLKELNAQPEIIAHKKELEALKEDSEEISSENSSPQDLIDAGFSKIESEVKADLLERLKTIDPYYFEKVILVLLQKMGYGDFIETPKSADGGIDGVINQDKLGLEKIYIQAKRYAENKVREKDIRNFIGAMSGDTQKGVFVTTSVFDEGAIIKAHEAHHTIILIDGKQLADLMHQYNVGVQTKDIYEVKELDEDFFEEQ